MNIPSLLRPARRHALLAAGMLAATLCVGHAIEYSATYEGDHEPPLSAPKWQEIKGGKKSEGTVSVSNGKLLVEVPPNARHYFAIGQSGHDSQRGDGSGTYNGSSPEGTTIDLSVTVASDDPEQAVFGLHIGRSDGRSVILFSPSGLSVDGRSIAHGTTEPDVYRFAFNQDALVVYTAKRGEIYRGTMRSSASYPHNALFFGTLTPMDLHAAGRWEVDFIRWTHAGSEFSPPKAQDNAR